MASARVPKKPPNDLAGGGGGRPPVTFCGDKPSNFWILGSRSVLSTIV
jgi:hypothetical protein